MICSYTKHDRTDKEDSLAHKGFNHSLYVEGAYEEITRAIQWCVTHCRGKFQQIRGSRSTMGGGEISSFAHLSFELHEDVLLFRLQAA